MNQRIEQYLTQLKRELSGCDRATIQDALSDTEEHLRTALDAAVATADGSSETDALATIIEKYGSPNEVAASYREMERLTPLPFSRPAPREQRSVATTKVSREPEPPDDRPFYARFFGVVLEPRAWGAFLYLFISMLTGIFYFTWVTTGMSLSLGLLVLIIGLPVAALFILSVRGLSLVEGRIVEALLGVRMPRRAVYQRRNRGWWPRFKDIVSDKYTWLSIIYMLLQMPLGIFYFTLFTVLISLFLLGFAIPVMQLIFSVPIFNINGVYYYLSAWLLPFTVIIGVLIGIAMLHLAKALGKLHGGLARLLLVRV